MYVQIYENTDIIDQVAFRTGLERIISEKKMDEVLLREAECFLKAWDRKLSGKDLF